MGRERYLAAMEASSRTVALALYRTMLRAGSAFSNYNMREYALRSVRMRFRENVGLMDTPTIADALQDARKNLQMLQRQSTVSQLFPQSKHCMEAGGEELREGSRFPGDPKGL